MHDPHRPFPDVFGNKFFHYFLLSGQAGIKSVTHAETQRKAEKSAYVPWGQNAGSRGIHSPVNWTKISSRHLRDVGKLWHFIRGMNPPAAFGRPKRGFNIYSAIF